MLYMHKKVDRSLQSIKEISTYVYTSSLILLAEGMAIPFV